MDKNITAKIDRYISHIPIEGIVLDQYMKNHNLCPFEKNFNFDMKTLQEHLRSKNMKLYLSFNAGIPTRMVCQAFEIAERIPGCLLTKADDSTDYSIGLGQKVNSTGSELTDFYEMAFIDVFNNDTANKCMNEMMKNFLEAQNKIHYDGLYLRGNEPFTISNGTDLDKSHYLIKNATAENRSENKWKLSYEKFKSKSKQMFGNVFNPEAIGQYEGYHISAN